MESARQHCPPSLSLLLGLLLPVLTVTPVHADFWYRHYDQAKKALKAGEWAEAIEQLEQALERRGDSGVKVRTYGVNFEEYFPHLKLGIAYYHMGQLAAALQAFETEEVLGAIARSRTASLELENYRSLARQGFSGRFRSVPATRRARCSIPPRRACEPISSAPRANRTRRNARPRYRRHRRRLQSLRQAAPGADRDQGAER